jgi:hypothetical protein
MYVYKDGFDVLERLRGKSEGVFGREDLERRRMDGRSACLAIGLWGFELDTL